jgi:hypothetical protein
MQNPCRRQAIITLGANATTCRRQYENFLQQVNLAEQLTSSDFGVLTGLISQGY